MAEHVILFAGPMGSGKTTAIRTLSDIEVLATEAVNTERNVVDKPSTTVALDYGEIGLGDEEKVRLYGIPGQRRFDFMWSILRERAHGLVLLVNNDAPDPIGAMNEFLDEFGDVLARVKNQTQTVLNTLDQAQTRSNVMHRALRQVEALPEAQAQALLPPAAEGDDATP